MSLREPHRSTPNTYLQQILDQLQRATAATGRPAAAFGDLCDRASIPRDLRRQLLDQLVAGRYVTRQGDEVQLTPAGQQVANSSFVPPAGAPTRPPPRGDREDRVRLPGSGPRPRRRGR
jgi:hypothetical protein